jgi:replicative DNA helicase
MTAFSTTARPRPFGSDFSNQASIVDRTPPHDLHAEAAVLGSMIIDTTQIGPVCQVLSSPSQFFKEENQIVFRVIRDLFAEGMPVDPKLIHSALLTKNLVEQIGGKEYLLELARTEPITQNAVNYAVHVKEAALRREMITRCTATLRDIYESGSTAQEMLDRWHQRVYEVADQKHSGQAQNMGDILSAAMDRMDKEGVVGDPKTADRAHRTR